MVNGIWIAVLSIKFIRNRNILHQGSGRNTLSSIKLGVQEHTQLKFNSRFHMITHCKPLRTEGKLRV